MPVGTDGLPDPARAEAFASADRPAYLTVGPDGNLWYASVGGSVRRIVYAGGGVNRAPTAALSATPTQGAAPLTVQFDGGGSRDPDAGDTVAAYDWDLDGDGGYGDAAGQRPTWTYQQPGTFTAALRVTDGHGARSAPATVRISAGNTSPTARISAPATGTLWQPGDPITFAGSAGDAQDGTLPAANLSWTITLQHCADGGGCHAHPLQDLTGVAGGSFPAPDHEYPSYVELQLTATDSGGLSDSATLRLDPRTVDLSFTSEPAGLGLTFGPASQVTPFTRRVIAGSRNSVSAPTPQTLAGTDYQFASWSDGGAASHDLTAPTSAATYTARYRQPDQPAPQAVTVAATVGVPSVPLGGGARIGGAVTPASPGETVALDTWSGGAWRQLRTTRLDQAGAFAFTVTPSATGSIGFRVRKLPGNASAGGNGASLTLKVYRTVIAGIRIVGPGLNGEYLELRNTGTTDVNLGTWTVHHSRLGWTLHLRPYVLRAGARVRVYSGGGVSGNGRLFLNRRISVWRSSRGGDLIQIKDGYRQVAAVYRYTRWEAGGDGAVGHVAGDHGAGGDQCLASDGHAGEDHRAGAEPAAPAQHRSHQVLPHPGTAVQHARVVGGDAAGPDERVVLHHGQAGEVGLRLDQDVVADADALLDGGGGAQDALLPHLGVLPHHHVVTRLRAGAQAHAAVEHGPGADQATGTDHHRPALARAGRVADVHPRLDHRSRAQCQPPRRYASVQVV